MTGIPAAVRRPIDTAVKEHGHHAAMLALVNRIAAGQGWPLPFPAAPGGEELPALADLNEVGEVHQILLAEDENRRYKQGSYYTPIEIARPMVRFTLEAQLQATPMDDAHELRRRILIVDPACGAGIFLALAARELATRYVQLLSGEQDVAEWTRRHFVAELAYECIFGMDIDPIATDLSKAAVWFEGDGSWALSLLDENIITGDTLNGDEPPRLKARGGGPTIAERVRDGAA